MLYFLLHYTTSRFSGVLVLAADMVIYAQGLRNARSKKSLNLHFPSGAQSRYLFSLTQPIQAIHQGVSKPSSRFFLLRVWKERNGKANPTLLFARWSVWPLSAGEISTLYWKERKTEGKSLKGKKESKKSQIWITTVKKKTNRLKSNVWMRDMF